MFRCSLPAVRARRPGISGCSPASMAVSRDPFTGWESNPRRGISIFDCPEQSQTSPIRMSSSTRGSPSSMVSVWGPPASGVSIRTLHRPDPSARTAAGSAPHEGVTVTLRPGSARPQMRASLLRWSTMPLPTSERRRTRPFPDSDSPSASSRKIGRFMRSFGYVHGRTASLAG